MFHCMVASDSRSGMNKQTLCLWDPIYLFCKLLQLSEGGMFNVYLMQPLMRDNPAKLNSRIIGWDTPRVIDKMLQLQFAIA